MPEYAVGLTEFWRGLACHLLQPLHYSLHPSLTLQSLEQLGK